MKRTTKSAIALAALGLAFSTAALADAPAWDQKQVLALGEKLATALRNADAASRAAPPQSTALQQRKRDAALTSVRQVRESADKYVSKLRAGGDRDTTEAYFRSVRNGLRGILRTASDAVPSNEVAGSLKTANEAIAELERYYPDL